MTSEVIASMTSKAQVRIMNERTTLLRVSLVANAVFSASTGAAMLAAPQALSEWLGLSEPSVLPFVGGALLPFALLLAWMATRPRIDPRLVALVSLSDFAWVLASVSLAVFASDVLSTTGLATVLGVALLVEVFGTAQLEGLRRTLVNPGGEPRLTLATDRFVDVPPTRAWAEMRDVGGYSEVAPTIDFSRILSGEGMGAVRECGDSAGRWTETCTLWEEGRRFRFHVNTDAEDYPYPFRTLQAEWYVRPEGEGSRIGMRFWVTMPGGWFGDLMVAVLMLPHFEPGIRELLDNWAARMREGGTSTYASVPEGGEARWEQMSAR